MPNWIAVTKAGEARALVPRLDAIAKRSLKFVAGDYFQNFDCWSGARPLAGAEDQLAVETEIEQGFVPQPLLGEVHARHVDGVVGREPAFAFVSSLAPDDVKTALDAFEVLKSVLIERRRTLARAVEEAESGTPALKAEFTEARAQLKAEAEMAKMLAALGLPAEEDLTDADLEGLPDSWLKAISRAKEIQAEIALLDEANAAIGTWWDKRRGHETLRAFTSQLCSLGSAQLRIWLPRGLLQDLTDTDSGAKVKMVPALSDWKKALDYIYLEVPQPESATVAIDRDTMRECSIFSYTTLEAASPGATPNEVQRIEISFRNDDGTTTVRILEEERVVDEVKQDLGGALYIAEARRTPLLTEALQRLQNGLNVINSMILRNGNLAGFPEVTYFNSQRPTVELPDPEQEGQKIKVPVEIEVGPGVRNFLTGIVTADGEGNQRVANASMFVRDPVSPEPLVKAAERFETNIYSASDQRHIQISGDATASAVSRVQARADYMSSLRKTASPVEGVLRSQLHAVLCLAAFLARDEKRLKAFKGFRTVVTCHLDAGPLAPDERRALVEEYDKGVRSLESTQLLLGTEDIDAERGLLEKEREASRAERKARLEEFRELKAAGVSAVVAARIAGFDQDDVEALEEDASSNPAEPEDAEESVAEAVE